jgi:hypothetical protein
MEDLVGKEDFGRWWVVVCGKRNLRRYYYLIVKYETTSVIDVLLFWLLSLLAVE